MRPVVGQKLGSGARLAIPKRCDKVKTWSAQKRFWQELSISNSFLEGVLGLTRRYRYGLAEERFGNYFDISLIIGSHCLRLEM